MTKYIKTIMLITFLIILGIGVFHACKKEESMKMKKEENAELQTGNGAKAAVYCYLCISEKGWKGEGKRPNKSCVQDKGRCWIWFQETEECDCMKSKGNFAIVSIEDDDTITLDFKYEYNNKNAFGELFDLEKGVFIIEEDIIEDSNSILAIFLKASSSSKIPAASYSITQHRDGIKVTLPVK
jgi:hypothetical protein